MINKIIENTVGKKGEMLFVLRKKVVNKYTDLDYKNLTFTGDLEKHIKELEEPKKYGLILIDADNSLSSVRKNLGIALKNANVVILANSLPPNRQRYVATKERPGNWFGEVWKVVYSLNFEPKLDFVTYNVGNGYTIINNSDNYKILDNSEKNITLGEFTEYRIIYTRVVNDHQLKQWYLNRNEAKK